MNSLMESWPRKHRITVDAYYRMAEAGLLASDERVELIEGEIIRLDQTSEPQPDLAVLVPRADGYRHAHPTPADILLLIEVSDSTQRYDRDVKVPLYARHGVPEVWIVDLQSGELLWFRSPQAGSYVEQGVMRQPGAVSPAALPGVGVDFSGILSG